MYWMGFVDLSLRIESHLAHGIDGNLGLRVVSSLRGQFNKINGLSTYYEKLYLWKLATI